MGLLKDFGQILSYQNSTKVQKKLQLIAAEQFIHVYELYHEWAKKKDCTCKILWGDEIEGHRIKVDPTTGKLSLQLQPLPKTMSFPLMLEYGRWMFEMIPAEPYKTQCNFQTVVESLRERYRELHSNEDIYLTIPSVPFLGVVTEEESKSSTFQNSITQSRFIDDKHISDHVRFRTLTQNIRERRGKTVDIRVPIFRDKNTDLTTSTYLEPYPGFIYMDAMAFGMGMSCLQCTFSTKDITHARYLHDSLHVISPLFLALTAATPIVKGKLMDWDVRWNIIGDSVDDRTENERNPESADYQPKSRYSSLSHYISNSSLNRPQYNDLTNNVNQDVVDHVKKILKQKDIEMDNTLINHLAILLSREFLIVHEKFNEMSEQQNALFEMINSTNWNSVRFKIPIDDHVGWRVEFRTMEIQLTSDENAAFNILVFIMVLMMHHISNLNLYIPMSLVDENFKRAHTRNAITEQKFYFRTNIRDLGPAIIKQMSLDEIFFGSKQNQFVGLLPIFIQFFDHPMICPKKKEGLAPTFKMLKSLWKFLKSKTTGQTMTLAQWMRKFVANHKDYQSDSIVTEQIWTDLVVTMDKISKGEISDDTFNSAVFEI